MLETDLSITAEIKLYYDVFVPDQLNAPAPLLIAVHMVHIDEADIELAVHGGINVVHCPQTNLKLGAGVSPAALLLAREVNVALGTGAAAGNNDLSLIDEARSAALLARGLHPQAHATPAHDWLRSATLNAARALGLGDITGSLVPGKWADLCCIDLNRAHTLPIYDVATQILYAASRDQVSDVWVAGRALVSEHRLTRMDLADIMQRAQRWQQRISAT